MAGGPIWYELMTPDPDGVRDFYRAVGGWEISPAGATTAGGGHDYRAIMRPGGGMLGGVLGMSQDMIDHGGKPGWIPYFHVEDVDASVAKLQGMGGKVFMPARTIEPGRMAMVADPQGAPFYLMTPTPPPDQPDAKSDVFDAKKPGHCRWMQLDTSDAPAANAFYTELFDWSTENTMPMGPAGDYRFIEFEGTQIGAFNPMLPEGESPHWLLFLGVGDVAAARDAALAHGGTISQDIHEVPGDDLIFVGRDPSGAKIGFVGPKGG